MNACAHTSSVHQDGDSEKKRERNETLVEEVPPPKKKLNKKRPKKVATPRKSPKTPRSTGKSPSPQKKGKRARAKPIQLEGPEFGPPEEPPMQTDQSSLIALENAHLHAFN